MIVSVTLLTSCNTHSDKSGKNEVTASKKFKLAWSIYSGWQPWDYANKSGILKKWAEKYGIQIDLIRMDYIPSVEAYTAGKVDACVMTNMEALDIPSASGVTSSAIIVGDYSNGNDAILTRNNIGLNNICGKDILIVQLSVSHYLLARAMEKNGKNEKCVKLINTNDSDIAPAFLANPKKPVVVTWNPLVMKIQKEDKVTNVFNSSQIPEEILDLLVVNSKTLSQNPELGKALTGAWYEVMNIMTANNSPTKNKAFEIMAESAGCSTSDFSEQLKTTAMYYKPQDAYNFIVSSKIVEKMNYVRAFCFEHGLFGDNAISIDKIGIKYPNNVIIGDTSNIQLIFNESFMKLAASKQL